eukprot:TRINITY_DN12201_c0_g1_i2.p2 TRINITY_DN12201_c0_g1~~TRINITY_DN12201_c0_g1_i2.p2  ORF type:complete len:115 (-),score=23.46 TRINITY_DN12201_c0_g1_i2:423-767(-)
MSSKAEEHTEENGNPGAKQELKIEKANSSNFSEPKKLARKKLREVEDYKYEQIPYEEIIEFDGSALSPIEIDFGERVFASLDKDNNGYIEPADMRGALKSMLHNKCSAQYKACT